MKKFTKYASLTVLSLVLFSSSVSADPLTQLQNSKNALQSQRQSIETKIEDLDNNIESLMGQIDANKKQIATTQDEIKVAQVDIQNCETDLQKTKELFQKRMRAMYINNVDAYVDILVKSNGIGDFLANLETVNTIIGHDKKIKKELTDKLNGLNKKKQDLNDKNDRLVALNSDSTAKLAKLNEDKQSQLALISQIASKQQTLSDQYKAIIDQARNAAPKLSRGSAPLNGNNIIAFASNYMGTPYVWGGTTPNPGFDCSGFTQYVFAHFGVRIGRTTYDQIKDGIAVSRSELQPGDLVLFGSYSDPHHVGIYVGNNSYIHAPHKGATITISSMDRPGFVVGRRIQ